LRDSVGTVAATEFKARCLELMDRVAEGRETYVITKRGRPVAKLVPTDPPKGKSVFGCMADRMEIVGDLDEPLWTDGQWKEFERQRSEQWQAWEREWRTAGTISGKRTVGRPSRTATAAARVARTSRRSRS
jgi:prevent-host-death family protein